MKTKPTTLSPAATFCAAILLFSSTGYAGPFGAIRGFDLSTNRTSAGSHLMSNATTNNTGARINRMGMDDPIMHNMGDDRGMNPEPGDDRGRRHHHHGGR